MEITLETAQELRAKYDDAVADYQKQLDDLDRRRVDAEGEAGRLSSEIMLKEQERKKLLLGDDPDALVTLDGDLARLRAKHEIATAKIAALKEERTTQELYGSDPVLTVATEILTGPGLELAEGIRAEITKAAQDYVARCRELLNIFSAIGSIRRDAVLLAARTGADESLPPLGSAAMPAVLMDSPGPAGSDALVPSSFRRFRPGSEPETLDAHCQRISAPERLGPSVDVGIDFPGVRRGEVSEITEGVRPADVAEEALEGHSDEAVVPDIAPHRQRGLLVNHKRAQ